MARHASSFRTSNSPRTAWSRPAVAPTLTLVALLIGGIWELFLGGAHKGHLLGWIATALCVGLVGLALEYLRSREHLSEVRLAHDRLRLALVSARSAVWDLNVKTGIDQWFGDLQTMFGIPSEMMSVQTRDFYRYVHPEDRQRVSEAIAAARSKRSAYKTEFRIVRQDETIHWVSATGEFSYSKRNDPERMLGMAVDITDRRQASEALFKSEEKFAKAFRESPIALTLTSARDTRYLDVNDTFAKITGWGRDEVIGRNPVDISIWVDASQRSEFIKQTLAHGTTRNFEVHYRCKNGEQRVGLGSGEIIDIEGEPSILTAVLDITDRKRSEESLLRKETELAEAQRLAQLGSWQMDPTNRSLTWSEELCRIHGFDPKGPLPSYDQLPQLFTPQSWQRLQEEMEIATQTGDFQDLELELIRPDGSKRWVTIRGQTVRSSAGKAISFRGTAQDITHVRQLVEQVRSSEARLGAIVGSAMDAIIVVDAKQQIILFNSAAEEMFRCPAGTVTGSDLDRFIPPPFSAEYQAHIQKLGQTSGTGRSKDNSSMLYAVRSNGEVFPIEASVSEVETDGKKLFTVIMRDVTQRQRAEQALRESEERFRLVANTAPVMIWMCGKDNSCNYVNKPWLDFTGRPVEAELGEGWRKGLHPEDAERYVRTADEAFERRAPFELEYRLRRHDDEYRWVLDIGVPRFNPDGSFAGYIGSCMDITERKLAEEAMSTIGRRLIEAHEEERTWIGRELHDDINQRLALLAVELDRWDHDNPSSVEIHDQIRRTQERITEITRDVQSLSHRLHSSKLEYLGLTTAANSFCKELSAQSKVAVHFRHADVPRHLPSEVSLCLFRVLQEALQNAVKYSGVRNFAVGLCGDSDSIELTVSDAGRGFEEQEAFTRHGLGLISMRERLQLVRGELSVQSKPGSGTTIRAHVPLKSEAYRSMAG